LLYWPPDFLRVRVMQSTKRILSALASPFVSVYRATTTIAYYTDKGARRGAYVGVAGAVVAGDAAEVIARAILSPIMTIANDNTSQGLPKFSRQAILAGAAGGAVGAVAGVTYGTYQAFFGSTPKPAEIPVISYEEFTGHKSLLKK
jgi:hypothetical protein